MPKPCADKSWDMFHIVPVYKIWMNKSVYLAELKFYSAFDVMFFCDSANLFDYLKPMVKVALMIVGHVKNKQTVEIEIFHSLFFPVKVP